MKEIWERADSEGRPELWSESFAKLPAQEGNSWPRIVMDDVVAVL